MNDGPRPRVAPGPASDVAARCTVLALLLALATGCGATAPDVPRPPNIVLVIGDDHGYRDFGFMGSQQVHTPNLDRLAAEGTVFRSAFNTASLCRPSLATLLTGLEPVVFGERMRGFGAEEDRSSALRRMQTLPRLLEAGGYATYHTGKFAEGSVEAAGFGDRQTRGRPVRGPLDPVFEFLEAHRDEPFFLWFAPTLPHLPFDAPEVHASRYRDLGLPSSTAGYLANIAWFDHGLGALLDRLDALDLRERTLVVYLADNGWEIVEKPPLGFGSGPHDPGDANLVTLGGPRGKASLYELGLRTPLILRQPGAVEAGQVVDALVSTTDLFPTLLDYAGIAPPDGIPGHDLRPLAEGRAESVRRDVVGLMESVRSDEPGGTRRGRGGMAGGGAFVRTPRWHYLWHFRGGERLFDTAADPGAERDVAAENPEVVRQLRRRALAWARQRGMRLGAAAGGAPGGRAERG